MRCRYMPGRLPPQPRQKVSADDLEASSTPSRQADGGRYPLNTLSSAEPAGYQLIGGKPVEIVSQGRHQVPMRHDRVAVVEPDPHQKPGATSLEKDAAVFRRPITDQ